MERLPLAAVRTFSVVARWLSISRAAEELSVTPSAVSHQIKALERFLGTALFTRDRNALKLTAAGKLYMAQVSEGLLVLTRATRTIKSTKGKQLLRVAAPPSLAALWLIERIGGFMKMHPDIAISVTASSGAPALLDTAFDVAIWYGNGNGDIPGLSVQSLGPNWVFPVCKPAFVKGEHPLRTAADLARCTLLDSADESYYQHSSARQPGWHGWLQAAGVPDIVPKRYLSFTPRILMHHGVRAGLGIGLSRTLLAADALASKELVVPFGPAVPQPITYSLVFPTYLGKRKDVAAFCAWAIAEAEESSRKLERVLKRVASR